MKKTKKGITLIELMVVLIIGSLGIFAVSSIVVESYKEWKRSRDVVSLQIDLDLACHMIKAIVEEARDVEVVEDGTHIIAMNQPYWIQEFYPNHISPNVLLWRNAKNSTIQNVITTLDSINFTLQGNIVYVNLNVRNDERTIGNSFTVYMRNSQ